MLCLLSPLSAFYRLVKSWAIGAQVWDLVWVDIVVSRATFANQHHLPAWRVQVITVIVLHMAPFTMHCLHPTVEHCFYRQRPAVFLQVLQHRGQRDNRESVLAG